MTTQSELQNAIARTLLALKSQDAKVTEKGNYLEIKQYNNTVRVAINGSSTVNTTRSFR